MGEDVDVLPVPGPVPGPVPDGDELSEEARVWALGFHDIDKNAPRFFDPRSFSFSRSCDIVFTELSGFTGLD